jgi:CBS domain-containing protein
MRALAAQSKFLHHHFIKSACAALVVPWSRSVVRAGCTRMKTNKAAAHAKRLFSQEATMTVRAILDTKGRQISYVDPDAKLMAAVAMLAQRRIGAVLVMKDQKLQGILSERDIVRVLGERGADVLGDAVSEVMTRKVITCRETDTVSFLMETMTTGKFRHLPVLDGDKVVGLISIGDVVKWRVKEYEHEQQALHDYIKTA